MKIYTYIRYKDFLAHVRRQSEYFVLPVTSLLAKEVQVLCIFNHNDCVKWFYGIFSKREGECKFLFVTFFLNIIIILT